MLFSQILFEVFFIGNNGTAQNTCCYMIQVCKNPIMKQSEMDFYEGTE